MNSGPVESDLEPGRTGPDRTTPASARGIEALVRGIVRSPAAPAVHSWPALVALGIGAATWEVLARIVSFPFFPPLTRVLAQLASLTQRGLIFESLSVSLVNLAVGFLIAATAGIGLGLAMGIYHRVQVVMSLYVNVLLSAPALVFAPVFFSIFGLSRIALVAVIIMHAIFIVIVNTEAAVRAVPRSLLEVCSNLQGTDRQLFRYVVLPAAAPSIMSGLRLGAGGAIIGMVNAEMFIAVTGLGSVVTQAGARLDSASVLAVLIVMMLTAFALMGMLRLMDRRINHWLPEAERAI